MDSNTDDIEYAKLEKEAKELLQRVSEIVDELECATSSGGNLAAKEEQLKAVSKSINTLERKNVAVPDSLRDMKTSLFSEISFSNEVKSNLANIGTVLASILQRIEKTQPRRKRGTRKRSYSSGQPSTHHSTYRPLIIRALQEKGGQASKHEVMEWIEKELEGKFQPGDLELRSRGIPTWIIRVQNERSSMVRDGIIKKDTPQGTWELNE